MCVWIVLDFLQILESSSKNTDKNFLVFNFCSSLVLKKKKKTEKTAACNVRALS